MFFRQKVVTLQPVNQESYEKQSFRKGSIGEDCRQSDGRYCLLAFCLWRYEHLQSAVIGLCFVVLGALLMQRALQEPSSVSRLDRSKTYFLAQRAKLLDRLSESGVDGSVYAVVAAMTLGDKSQLTKELRDTYAVSGASHILALSGLHLGIIYTLLSLLLSRRRWQVISQVVIIVCIWLFVFLVGMSASVVRSAVMITVYALLGLCCHRDAVVQS